MKIYLKQICTKIKFIYRENDNELNTILLLSLLTFVLYFYLNGGWMTHVDSIDYIYGIDSYFYGTDWIDTSLAFRPGVMILSFPLTFLFSNIDSIGIHNLFFYILIGPLFYFFTLFFTSNKFLSLYTSLFFITSFPVLYWGISILNDLGSWFFILFLYFLCIKLSEKNYQTSLFMLTALLTGFGVLYKTTVGCVGLFFTILLFSLDRHYNFAFIFKRWLLFTTISLIPIIINEFYIFHNWEFSNLNFLNETFDKKTTSETNISSDIALKYTWKYKFLTLFLAFPFLPICLYGINICKREVSSRKFSYIIFMFISSFLMVLLTSTTTATPRYTFILFPAVYLFFIYGLDNLVPRLITSKKINNGRLFPFLVFTNLLVSIVLSTQDSFFREVLGFWPKL